MSTVTQDTPNVHNHFFNILQTTEFASCQSEIVKMQEALSIRGRSKTWPWGSDPRIEKLKKALSEAQKVFCSKAIETCSENSELMRQLFDKFYSAKPKIEELFYTACGGEQFLRQLPKHYIALSHSRFVLMAETEIPKIDPICGVTIFQTKEKKRSFFSIVATDQLKNRMMFTYLIDKQITLVRNFKVQHREYIENFSIRHDFFKDLFNVMQAYKNWKENPVSKRASTELDQYLTRDVKNIVLAYLKVDLLFSQIHLASWCY